MPHQTLCPLTLHGPLQDVKLYAALCIAYLLRIYAPDSPFEDDPLKVNGAALVLKCTWASAGTGAGPTTMQRP